MVTQSFPLLIEIFRQHQSENSWKQQPPQNTSAEKGRVKYCVWETTRVSAASVLSTFSVLEIPSLVIACMYGFPLETSFFCLFVFLASSVMF